MTVVVRPAHAADEDFLRRMLHQALFVPPGSPPFPADIVRSEPRLAACVDGFGSGPLDRGVVALDGTHPVGAAWVRLVDHGYGHVADDIPELTIAVVDGHRGEGIGTLMLLGLVSAVELHAPGISLSVDRRNPAMRLYERFEFTVDRREPPDTIVMVRRFQSRDLPGPAPILP